jgi:isopentenyl-diphosphate delta-isomerase type 1
MAEEELLDQVDEQGNVIGKATRAEFHSNPKMIHQVVHSWIFNKEGEILWQQRSMRKATSPGKWDMSCGGHILSGQTADETIIKELEEELGIKNAEPILVDKYIAGSQYQTELVNLYYIVLDKETEFTLQEEEVEKVEWIIPKDAQRMVQNKERESTEFIFSQVNKILDFINSKGTSNS